MFSKLRRLEIRCLGPPTVRVDGEEPAPDVLWRKHLALLVYLALSPQRSRSRDHLLGLLWPEKDEGRARHSLNEAIRRLRVGLGSKRLVSKGDSVTLNGDDLHVDAHAEQPEGGEFLDGLALTDAPAFESWVEQERARYRDRSLATLLTSGEQALSAYDLETARDVARQCLDLDAEAESAVRLQLRAAALSGDSSGALKVYRTFARRIEQEYGERPSKELRALAERIREGRWHKASLAHTDAEPPLIGREREHQTAFAEIGMALGGGPRSLVVGGLAGTGRTRLLAECVNRWRLEGGAVAVAHPLETGPDVPWSTLRQLMRGGLLDAPGLTATDPTALRTLSGVVPRLADKFTPVDGVGHTDIGDALAALVCAVSDETPLALVIDDVHRADEATLSALRGALSSIADRPILLVLGVLEADAEVEPPALTRLVGEVGRRLAGSVVVLEAFTDEEVRTLVDALAAWCVGDEQRDRLMRRVVFETGGDPFLAVALLRGLAEVSSLREEVMVWPGPNTTLETPVPFDVPQLVRAATMERLRGIDDCARKVLIAGCVANHDLDPTVVEVVAELSPGEIEDALAQLERHHLVTFDGERYYIEAALLREVVLSELLTPGQRKNLQSRYQDALHCKD